MGGGGVWGWREAASGIDVVRLFETIKSGATENGARAQRKLVICMVLDDDNNIRMFRAR